MKAVVYSRGEKGLELVLTCEKCNEENLLMALQDTLPPTYQSRFLRTRNVKVEGGTELSVYFPVPK